MARAPLLLALSALLLAGCINMSSPTKLAPGASAEAIRAQLGEPTGSRQHPHPFGHRERQAMRLPRPVVGVLPEYHHPHFFERSGVESIKNKGSRRINNFTGSLFFLYTALILMRNEQSRALSFLQAEGCKAF